MYQVLKSSVTRPPLSSLRNSKFENISQESVSRLVHRGLYFVSLLALYSPDFQCLIFEIRWEYLVPVAMSQIQIQLSVFHCLTKQ